MNIQKSLLALAHSPEKIVYFDGLQEITEDYASLFKRSLALLGGLQGLGLEAGAILLLDIPGVYDQITCFWACILGGIVPAILPDASPRQSICEIAKGLPTPTLLTTRSLNCEGLPEADYTTLTRNSPGQIVRRKDQDPGMIQLTSGSTGKRRNVLLSLRNLWVGGMASSVVVRPGVVERYLNWLPLSHCFGLVGYHLVPLVNGFPQYQMNTAAFVQQPQLWLSKISQFRATMTGAARFGINLATADKNLRQISKIDLSSLYICFCGGEDLLAEELERFEDTFSPMGLPRGTLKPAYGLSETTMGVAYTPPGRRMKTEMLRADSVTLGSPLIFSEAADSLRRLSVGILDECNQVQIRDAKGNPLPDGSLGEVHICGDNLMTGYLQADGRLEAARDEQGYFNTGDLGFFHQGWLCLYGRLKDILIINGKNINRLDLEKIAGAACLGQGEFALMQERQRGHLMLFGTGVTTSALKDAARAITRQRGMTIAGVIKVKKMPRTEAGKLDRLALERGLEQGTYALISLDSDSKGGMNEGLDPGEARLAELWACVLEVDQSEIAMTSDFFMDLGGCSLTSMDLISQIEETFGIETTPEVLLNHPTLKEMASLLNLPAASR